MDTTDIEHIANTRNFGRRTFLGLAGSAALGVAGFALFGCSANSSSGGGDAALEVSEKSAADLLEERVNELLAEMSDHEKLCQLFVITPESLMGLGKKDAVTQAGDTTKEALAAHPVAGIIYFAKNLLNAEQTSLMLANTFDFASSDGGIPPLLCVDEEGGTVVRVAGKRRFSAENVGNMSSVGATGDPAQAKEAAEYIGDYLSELGFNTDFAPVCDVANNPNSDTMRKRSFGSDPELVAKMVRAQVEGFAEADMLCSAKHFPGIGAAVGDSHNEQITYTGTLDQLKSCELVPFRAAIEAGVPLVMVGHLSLPEIVGDETPACLSKTIVTDILRDDLGFGGIAITDSLSMDAICDYYGANEAAVMAIEAGCDLLLMPEDFSGALAAVNAALETGRLDWEHVDESVRRILRVKVKHFLN